MLTIARQRFLDYDAMVSFEQGDAMALPFDAHQFDGAVVSFGLRNVADIPQALSEMVRVIKPGGWVVNLDTCPTPTIPGLSWYFTHVMPRLGQLFSKDLTAYRYLSKSTRHFLTPAQLVTCFHQVGLQNIASKTMGLGMVSLQAGQKPQ